MYALMTSQSGLPTVVNMNSYDYPFMLMQGYTKEDTGQKTDMEQQRDDLISEIYGGNGEIE